MSKSVTITKKWLIDAGERVGMTVAYAVVSEAVVELSGIDQTWTPLFIVALTALKTLIAKKIGDPASASLVPSVVNSPVEPTPPAPNPLPAPPVA